MKLIYFVSITIFILLSIDLCQSQQHGLNVSSMRLVNIYFISFLANKSKDCRVKVWKPALKLWRISCGLSICPSRTSQRRCISRYCSSFQWRHLSYLNKCVQSFISVISKRIRCLHLLSTFLFVFPFVTHDRALHKFGQHLPPREAHSLSSLHFGVHVVTWLYDGQSGFKATTNAKRAKTTNTWRNFIVRKTSFNCEEMIVDWLRKCKVSYFCSNTSNNSSERDESAKWEIAVYEINLI